MAEPLLLLRLEGPLQSWGGRSRWDVRDTGTEPTKSGVVGLLGCALGYAIADPRLEGLDRHLRFGVRVEAPGRLLRDYQTVSGFLPTANRRYRHTGVKTGTSLARLRGDPEAIPATIESPRYYLEEASFLAALARTEGAPPTLLEECAAALQAPVWPLYLGRKACVPTRPIFEALTEQYASLEEALLHHPWSVLGVGTEPRPAQRPPELVAYVEDRSGPVQRQDAIRVNPARQYGFHSYCSIRCAWTGDAAGGD